MIFKYPNIKGRATRVSTTLFASPISSHAAALLAFAILLSSTTHSAFAQAGPPTTDPPSATEPTHTIIAVHLDTATGDIKVGRTTYHGANPGFHLLALQRQPDLTPSGSADTPLLISERVVSDAASANQFMQTVLSNPLTKDAILIVNGVGNYAIPLMNVAANLERFGAQADLETNSSVVPFIFVGNGGRNKGGALQRGGSTLPVDGYLALDQNSNYAFLQTDFVRYDIGLDGTIKVGNATYDVASSYKPGCPADTSNSFHVVILTRETLQPTLVNNTYCTATSDVDISRLWNDITSVLGNREDLLVFIASNGHPIPSNWDFGTDGDARIYPFAQLIAKLGGYFETVAYLTPTDTFSFVGAMPPRYYVTPSGFVLGPRDRAAEGSSVYPALADGKKPTGELHGVLGRGRNNWYSPRSTDTSGLANLQLYTLLAMPPSSFPSFTGDQLTAFQTINLNLCSSTNCLRDAYGTLTVDLSSGYQTPLVQMVDPATQKSCDLSANAGLPFCVVRAQLLDELKNVSQVKQLYQNVDSLWSKNGLTTLTASLSAYNDVLATIPAPPDTSSSSLVKPLVNFFLDLAGHIPVVGPAFGIVNTAFNLGMDLTTDPKGNKAVDLTATIGQLQEQTNDNFVSQQTTTGTMFQILMGDYAKLNALGTALLTQTDTKSPWYWAPNATGQMLNEMKIAARQAAYQSIMPAAYAIGKYLPQDHLNCFGSPWSPNPVWGEFPLYMQPGGYTVLDTDYICGNAGNTPAVTPFRPTNLPFYIPYTYPTDSNNPFTPDNSDPIKDATGTMLADGGWLGISAVTAPTNSGKAATYSPPDLGFLGNLFRPVWNNNGVGVYRPAFFEGWPFTRVNCGPSYYITPGNNGCNWSAAAPPVQSTPGPGVPGVAIRAYQMGKNETQVQVLLIISNNGTLSADLVEISSIKLRTLGGSGVATVVSPALPAQVTKLPAGGSTNLVLTLNIPSGITKLGITEEGVMNVGQPQSVKFSEGQVVLLQQ